MATALTRSVPAEVRMLAAIRTWAVERRPHIGRVLPDWAAEGAPLLIAGHGFGDGVLEARFGRVSTWALALSDRLAVSLVPPAAGSPLVLFRRTLGSNAVAFRAGDDDGPTRVVRVDPDDGAPDVLRDTPVLLRFSRALDASSLVAASVALSDVDGSVSGQLRLSPDARVLIWQATSALRPGAIHQLEVRDLRDARGEPVAPHSSGFATGPLTREDLFG